MSVDLQTAMRLAHAAYRLDLANESNNPSINDQDSAGRAATAASYDWLQDNGWRFLSSADVPSLLDSGLFVSANGYGAALLAVKEQPGNTTLAIAFRGTNDVSEASGWWTSVSGVFGRVPEAWGDHYYWTNRAEHYQLFAPLFNDLETSINDDSIVLQSGEVITNIFVTGHSLGASMVEYFVDEYEFGLAAVPVSGTNFATPGTGPERSEFQNADDLLSINLSRDAISAATFFSNRAGEFNSVLVPLNEELIDQNDQGPDEIHAALTYLGAMHAMESIGLDEQKIREMGADIILNLELDNSELEAAFSIDGRSRISFSDNDLTVQPILLTPSFQVSVSTPNGLVELQRAIQNPVIIAGGNGTDSLTGREFGDLFFGLGGDDRLVGLGGNDTLNGGDGIDTAVFTSDRSEFRFDVNESGGVDVSNISSGETDTIFKVERLEFPDMVTDQFGNEIVPFGPTLVSIPQDLVLGEGDIIAQEWTRSGDLSYGFEFFNDGEFIRPSDFFFQDGSGFFSEGQTSLDWGVVPINRPVFGPDELAEVTYTIVGDEALRQAVQFSVNGGPPSDTAVIRYLSIGDAVDDRGGGVWGDPHLLTFDNLGYDFQAAGEFVLAHATTGDPYIVQARFVAISSAVSVTEAVGTLVDGSTVTVEADGGDGTIVVDGVVTEVADGASVTIGGGTVSRDGNGIQIDHGNGDVTLVAAFTSFLSVAPQPSLARDPGSLEGLLGNGNGTPADDFRLSDGSVLTTPVPVETLYGEFADSWRVQPGDRLLPGDPEPFAAPERIITLDSIPQDLREQAEAAVDAMGITNPILRDAAILDFALTGDEQFIEASQLLDESFDPLVDTIAVDPVSNPVIVLSAGTLTIDEDDPATRVLEFTVSRGATVGDVTVNFSASGIGVSPTDADDFVGNITSGSVQIPDGLESQTFTLEIANDALDEGTENFSVSIEVEPAQAAEYEVLVSSVNISVLDDDEPVNTAPTAIELSPASVDENAAAATIVGAITVSDPDAGDTHMLELVDDASGRFALDGSDIVVAAGAMLDFEAEALHEVTVRATDAGGLSVDQDITIAVNDVDEAPVGVDDIYTTAFQTALTIAAAGVLANDTDVEGDTLSAVLDSGPTNGTLMLNADGSFSYTPNAGFSGTDTLTYLANDGTSDAAAPATVTIIVDDPDVPEGTDGPDDIFNPLGGQSFALGGGADVVRGPVQNFFDDLIDGFGLDDLIVFEGSEIARSAIDVTFGSAILAVDADGDGSSNGQFTLEGDFSGGDFMAVGDSGDTLVTFEAFLPELQERQAVDPDLVNGIINQNFLKGDGTTDFQVTLRDLGFAGYDNVLGVYEIDATGNIVDTRILFENANADKAASARIEDVEDGHNLGFFIVQDAADWAATLAAGDTLSFVNSSGGAANVSDGADISIAVNGAAVDEMVFHSFDEDMNSDGLQHALSGVEVGGEAITVGFEDLTGGGDRDYEDVAFRVELVDDLAII